MSRPDRIPSDIETYLKDIGTAPLLTAEDEKRLGRLVQRGDAKARERMIRSNLRLVVSIAKRYANRGLSLLDLIEEGNLGLLKAVENFDPALGTRFSTYATWWIKQAIRRSLINSVKMIRVPAYMVETIARLKHAEHALLRSNGREPTFEELAKRLHITRPKMEIIRRAIRAAASAGSLSASEAAWALAECLEDHRVRPPDEEALTRQEWDKLRRVIKRIDKREAEILRLRYGLEDRDPMTLEGIGRRLGLTRERVRQIENDALKRLHRELARERSGR